MSPRKLFLFGMVFLVFLSAAFLSQSPQSRPDFAGKWTLVDGGIGASSPLASDGVIAQDGTSVTLQSLRIPFDGSPATRQDNSRAFVWQYEGHWVGKALVVSMKATSGTTPGNFEDVMVLSLSAPDTMTMVIMRTTIAGTMQPYTLTYKKS